MPIFTHLVISFNRLKCFHAHSFSLRAMTVAAFKTVFIYGTRFRSHIEKQSHFYVLNKNLWRKLYRTIYAIVNENDGLNIGCVSERKRGQKKKQKKREWKSDYGLNLSWLTSQGHVYNIYTSEASICLILLFILGKDHKKSSICFFFIRREQLIQFLWLNQISS